MTTLEKPVQPRASSSQLTRANTIMLTATTKKMNVVPQRLCSVRIFLAFSTVRVETVLVAAYHLVLRAGGT